MPPAFLAPASAADWNALPDTALGGNVSALPGVSAPPGAPPPAVPAPPAPVPVAALPQIAIDVASDPGSGQIDLRLSPEELGRIRMQIHCDGNDLRVLILADRAETLDLLRRNGPALLSEFADAGFSRAALDFGLGGAAGGLTGGTTGEPEASPAEAPAGAAETPQPWPVRTANAAGRLDLRL